MIIIRKYATGEVFDLPAYFVLEMENTSPLFNTLGSKSVSAMLPATLRNNKLLGMPNRIDNANMPSVKMPVVVESGAYIRKGQLYCNAVAGADRSLSVIIAFDEGEMYETMGMLSLKELSNLPVVHDTVENLVSMLSARAYSDPPDAEYSVFPLCISEADAIDSNESHVIVNNILYEKIFYLNRIVNIGNQIGGLQQQTCYVDGETVNQVNFGGFGISPFIRVWKVIELIFAHFGFVAGENPYKTHPQLRKLCLLNNVADHISGGSIDYRSMMPDCTVQDFFDSLYARQSARLFYNSGNNVADIRFVKDIIADGQNMKSFDAFATAPADVEFAAPKQIKLSGQCNLYNAKAEPSTFEDFLKKYNNQMGRSNSIYPNTYYAETVMPAGIYFQPRYGVYFQVPNPVIKSQAEVDALSDDEKKQYQDYLNNAKIKFVSSVHFDWNRQAEGLEYEEITGKDECLSMRPFNSYNPSGSHPEADNYNDYDWYVCPVYSAGLRFVNSMLITGKSEEAGESPLSFAFSMGVSDRGVNFGSIFPFKAYSGDISTGQQDIPYMDESGNTYDLSLTFTSEYGAFKKFWAGYDAILRHSGHTHRQAFKLSPAVLSQFDFKKPFLSVGQPLLPDKFTHRLGLDTPVMLQSRTIRLYEPYDLDTEQAIPQSQGILYKWVQYDNREQAIADAIIYVANLFNILVTDVAIYSWPNGEITSPTMDVWMLPPIEQQYQSGLTWGLQTYAFTAKFRTHANGFQYYFDYDIPIDFWMLAEEI